MQSTPSIVRLRENDDIIIRMLSEWTLLTLSVALYRWIRQKKARNNFFVELERFGRKFTYPKSDLKERFDRKNKKNHRAGWNFDACAELKLIILAHVPNKKCTIIVIHLKFKNKKVKEKLFFTSKKYTILVNFDNFYA